MSFAFIKSAGNKGTVTAFLISISNILEIGSNNNWAFFFCFQIVLKASCFCSPKMSVSA